MFKAKNPFLYRWELKNGKGFPAKNISYHGATVFSCFSGGGGSSMGYKLAGYNVMGCNEIDKKQLQCYQANLGVTPYQFDDDIRLLYKRTIPKELMEVDILDGSPPCTAFSMSGQREKIWNKEKYFEEGKIIQKIDDLVFDFLKFADKIQPKIILIENVVGLLLGTAAKYLQQIMKILDKIGYSGGYRKLQAARMGLPQRRERIFFWQ